MNVSREKQLRLHIEDDLKEPRRDDAAHLKIVRELKDRFATIEHFVNRTNDLLQNWRHLHYQKNTLSDTVEQTELDKLAEDIAAYAQEVHGLETDLLQLEAEAADEEETWWSTDPEAQPITYWIQQQGNLTGEPAHQVAQLELAARQAFAILNDQKNGAATPEQQAQYGLLKREALRIAAELTKVTVAPKAPSEVPAQDAAARKKAEIEARQRELHEEIIDHKRRYDILLEGQEQEINTIAQAIRCLRVAEEAEEVARRNFESVSQGTLVLQQRETVLEALIINIQENIQDKIETVTQADVQISLQQGKVDVQAKLVDDTKSQLDEAQKQNSPDRVSILELKEDLLGQESQLIKLTAVLEAGRKLIQPQRDAIKNLQDKDLVNANAALYLIRDKRIKDQQEIEAPAFVTKQKAEEMFEKRKEELDKMNGRLAAMKQIKRDLGAAEKALADTRHELKPRSLDSTVHEARQPDHGPNKEAARPRVITSLKEAIDVLIKAREEGKAVNAEVADDYFQDTAHTVGEATYQQALSVGANADQAVTVAKQAENEFNQLILRRDKIWFDADIAPAQALELARQIMKENEDLEENPETILADASDTVVVGFGRYLFEQIYHATNKDVAQRLGLETENRFRNRKKNDKKSSSSADRRPDKSPEELEKLYKANLNLFDALETEYADLDGSLTEMYGNPEISDPMREAKEALDLAAVHLAEITNPDNQAYPNLLADYKRLFTYDLKKVNEKLATVRAVFEPASNIRVQ